MAITAYWVDPEFKLPVVLLNLHQFVGTHTDKNRTAYFWSTLQKYRIENKVRKFNIDNARNTDTTLQEIAQIIYPNNIPPIHPVHDQLHRFDHMINLVVNGFL